MIHHAIKLGHALSSDLWVCVKPEGRLLIIAQTASGSIFRCSIKGLHFQIVGSWHNCQKMRWTSNKKVLQSQLYHRLCGLRQVISPLWSSLCPLRNHSILSGFHTGKSAFKFASTLKAVACWGKGGPTLPLLPAKFTQAACWRAPGVSCLRPPRNCAPCTRQALQTLLCAGSRAQGTQLPSLQPTF